MALHKGPCRDGIVAARHPLRVWGLEGRSAGALCELCAPAPAFWLDIILPVLWKRRQEPAAAYDSNWLLTPHAACYVLPEKHDCDPGIQREELDSFYHSPCGSD